MLVSRARVPVSNRDCPLITVVHGTYVARRPGADGRVTGCSEGAWVGDALGDVRSGSGAVVLEPLGDPHLDDGLAGDA